MDTLLQETLESLYEPPKESQQFPLKEIVKQSPEEIEEEDVLENVIKSFEKPEASREKFTDFSDPLDLFFQFEENEKVFNF